jgi:hypothetical protein
MLARLTGQADYCRERALESYVRAGRCQDEKLRSEYGQIARRWHALVRSFELAEQVSGFLDWNAKRLEPPDELRS